MHFDLRCAPNFLHLRFNWHETSPVETQKQSSFLTHHPFCIDKSGCRLVFSMINHLFCRNSHQSVKNGLSYSQTKFKSWQFDVKVERWSVGEKFGNHNSTNTSASTKVSSLSAPCSCFFSNVVYANLINFVRFPFVTWVCRGGLWSYCTKGCPARWKVVLSCLELPFTYKFCNYWPYNCLVFMFVKNIEK